MFKNKLVIKSCVLVCSVLIAFLLEPLKKLSYDDSEERDQFQELVGEAQEKYPDDNEIVALTKLAEEKSSNYFESNASLRDKQAKAADIFFGYYLINVKAREDFCKGIGIDISHFTYLFKASVNREFLIAKAIRKYTPYEINQLYIQSRPSIDALVKKDMESLSSRNNLSIKDGCRYLINKGKDIVEFIHISNVNPNVYEVLIEAEKESASLSQRGRRTK
ncbi:hypothetical protein OFY17_02415 [Marinomonas sp. C2222]|uniref:Uncharacterized protein n=1 Tax=Marinomonas sargassi TaxID=2984494 RepID=A0ABT2YPV1_9GAMM|nr:hypothetical protein [Marinomonas sargassi]MCV2401729.1 hypothetical protein [Marinomonas sargassi]